MMSFDQRRADRPLGSSGGERRRTERGEVGVVYGGPAVLQKRVENAFLIGAPLAGSVACPFWFWGHPIGWIEISAFFIGYAVIGLGVGLGMHRYFTHRSFATRPWVAWLLGAAASMACQGSVLRWVVDHRRHHARTDAPGDVHSPYVGLHGKRLSGVRGLMHAHVGWMFDGAATDCRIFGRDLTRDRLIMFFHRPRWLWPAVSLSAPWVWGYVLGGFETACGCLLFAGCFRTTLFHNLVWAVNSVGHTRGYRSFETCDGSRNNAFLAWATFGEGWHNNHHRYPRCAFHGLAAGQTDLNGGAIRCLAKLGLAHRVVYPAIWPDDR